MDKTERVAGPIATAFQQTIYEVHLPDGPLELHIGKAAPQLMEYMNQQGVKHAALLTAYNPQAQLTDQKINRYAQMTLLRSIEALSLAWRPALHKDPTQQWPNEPSFLILGITVEQARWMARRFRQLAFVSIRADGTPRLHYVQQTMPTTERATRQGQAAYSSLDPDSLPKH